jgi:dTDP-4-dehydrorhamnose 3,5-epimerase
MKIQETNLEGLVTIEPSFYDDHRGFFLECYQAERFKKIGIHDEFVQDNHSRSRKGVLRGMHFQISEPQSQLLTVIRGEIFDVCVEVRKSSKTYGQWYGIIL